MNLQLFPDDCMPNTAKAWCPMTDLKTYIIIFVGTAILVFGAYWIIKLSRTKCRKLDLSAPKEKIE